MTCRADLTDQQCTILQPPLSQGKSLADHVRVLAAVTDEIAFDDPARATEIALRAETVARTIEDVQHRDSALAHLALSLARVDPDVAQTVAQAIPDSGQQSYALANLARRLALGGKSRTRRACRSGDSREAPPGRLPGYPEHVVVPAEE